jgi:hypothetical protein
MFEGVSKKLSQMKKDFSFELSDFLVESKAFGIGNSLARAYGSCDNFNTDSNSRMADEEELINCAQILLLEMQ